MKKQTIEEYNEFSVRGIEAYTEQAAENKSNTKNKPLPEKWWDQNINPILGYQYSPLKSRVVPSRNKFEFPKEDDHKIFEKD
jgi:hypothetical protein